MSKTLTVDKPSYIDSSRCDICKAHNKKGDKIRDDVDAMFMAGDNPETIAEFLSQNDVFVSPAQIAYHLKNHSAFIYNTKKELTRKQRVMKKSLSRQKREADDALDRVINIGDRMVENYQRKNFEGKEIDGEPEMEVTERLYVEALKEQGRRGITNKLDEVFSQMEREAVIDGEIVEDEEPKEVDSESKTT